MVHKIETFITAKKPAWHNLGIVTPDATTTNEAIKIASLDWEVKKTPIYTGIDTKTFEEAKAAKNVLRIKDKNKISYSQVVKVENKFALTRTDNGVPLDVVGSRYEPIQNSEAFKFLDDIVGKNKAIIETAGSLDKGKIVFVTAKLPTYINVAGEDIEKYLLICLHHGGGPVVVQFTPIRVVCYNTLQVALKEKNKGKVVIRHTSNGTTRFRAAAKILGISRDLSHSLSESYNHMVKTKFNDRLFGTYADLLFLTDEEMVKLAKGEPRKEVLSTRKRNVIQQLYNYREIGPGQNFYSCKGTAWGAYNAITGYLHNSKIYKDDESKFKNEFISGDKSISEKAFYFAIKPNRINQAIERIKL